MMNLIIGFLLGLASFYLFFILTKFLRQKKGIRYDAYKGLPLLLRLKDTLRHIVYEYSIKRDNHDFLLNIFHGNKVVMQVMHGAHFPYLRKKENEINFGLALYIPISKLTELQRQELEKILTEDMDNYQRETEPYDYYVMDIGKRIRHGGYFICRILKEVFKFEINKNDFDFKLFDEGELPYFGEKRGFTIVSN